MASSKVGIDIGGSNIKIMILGPAARKTSAVATPKNKQKFFKVLKKILDELPKNISGIGVGVPGVVDRETGEIFAAPNLPFLVGKDLKKFLSHYHRNIKFDNDVKCILRAEHEFGAAKNLNNAVLIALGTGIGGGLLIDGKIYYGSGGAGEIGHIILDNNKSLEQLAGGKTLRKLNNTEFKRVGKYVGIACANVINLLAPDAVIVTGGVITKSGSKILPVAKKQVKKFVLKPKAKKTPIVPGRLGDFAGSLGAALIV